MEPGAYCRPLVMFNTKIELHLRPSNYIYAEGNSNQKEEIMSEFISNPASIRQRKQQELILYQHRVHAVCTVQTFMHVFSGPMLYMFIKYYQLMGWKVIVYDRFGLYQKYLQELLSLPGVDYYPFTVYQLAQPSKYSTAYRASQGTDMKTFYKMEVNWGFSSKKLADTADQDADKTRTVPFKTKNGLGKIGFLS
jgi:hypothetical protein